MSVPLQMLYVIALHVQLQEYQNKLKSLKEAATTSEENERKLSVQLIQQKENYERY